LDDFVRLKSSQMTPDSQAEALVAQLGGAWHGNYALCLCPAHDDRSPSLSVRAGDRAVLVHCFAGCAQEDIFAALPRSGRRGREAPPIPSRVRAKIDHDYRALARKSWNEAKPLSGSLAATYLASRHIHDESLRLRFVSAAFVGPKTARSFHPAMIAAVEDESGITAIHRTFLRPDGLDKADLAEPKRLLGNPGGGAVRLGGVPTDGILRLAEGIEDAASVMNLLGCGKPVWPVLGIERYASIEIPQSIRQIIIYSQPGAEAVRAIERASAPLTADGRELLVKQPPGGGDWNDFLREIRGV
jgi:putative DNA primase/helicase